MNQDTLKGQWKQMTGSVKERWGELTDNDMAEAEGNYDQLVGKVQERYGRSHAEAKREVDEWMQSQN